MAYGINTQEIQTRLVGDKCNMNTGRLTDGPRSDFDCNSLPCSPCTDIKIGGPSKPSLSYAQAKMQMRVSTPTASSVMQCSCHALALTVSRAVLRLSPCFLYIWGAGAGEKRRTGSVCHPANPLISSMKAQDLDKTNQTGPMSLSLPTKTG